MEYVITFSDVMTALITAGGTVMVFFIRRWFNGLEERNREIQEQIEKNNAKVNERIDKLEEKTGQDISDMRQEINDIKGDFATSFVLREDFFRSMNGVEDRVKSIDAKIDRLLMNSRQ